MIFIWVIFLLFCFHSLYFLLFWQCMTIISILLIFHLFERMKLVRSHTSQFNAFVLLVYDGSLIESSLKLRFLGCQSKLVGNHHFWHQMNQFNEKKMVDAGAWFYLRTHKSSRFCTASKYHFRYHILVEFEARVYSLSHFYSLIWNFEYTSFFFKSLFDMSK